MIASYASTWGFLLPTQLSHLFFLKRIESIYKNKTVFKKSQTILKIEVFGKKMCYKTQKIAFFMFFADKMSARHKNTAFYLMFEMC